MSTKSELFHQSSGKDQQFFKRSIMGNCQAACASNQDTSFHKDNGTRYRTHQEKMFAVGMAVKLEPIRKVALVIFAMYIIHVGS